MLGDCGAIVVDSETREMYGHIVAGDPMTNIAYIVPAIKVFEDIRKASGYAVELPSASDLSLWAVPRIFGGSTRANNTCTVFAKDDTQILVLPGP